MNKWQHRIYLFYVTKELKVFDDDSSYACALQKIKVENPIKMRALLSLLYNLFSQ